MATFDDLFDSAGRQHNVDPLLLRAVYQIESGSNPASRDSSKGAQGGMQMLPATAAAMGASDPRDMRQAIPAAARYLAEGLDAHGSPEGAAMYYHGGPDQRQWGPTTVAYARNVAATYAQLQRGGAKEAPDPDAEQDASIRQSFSTQPPEVQGLLGRWRAERNGAPPAAGADTKDDETVGSSVRKAFGSGPPDQAQPLAAAAPAAQPTAKLVGEANPYEFEAQMAPASADVASLAAGAGRGIRNMIDKPAEWLARSTDAIGLTSGQGPQVAAGNVAAREAYQQRYAGNALAGAGEVGGELAAGVPMAMGGNALLGGAARFAGGAGLARFVTGQSGGAMALPSLAAQGAAMGAGSAAVTGDNVGAGALTGAVAGPVAAGVMGAGLGTLNLLAGRSGSVSPEVAALAREAQIRGIPLRADQISTNPFFRTAGDTLDRLPLTGAAGFREEQGKAFSKAVAATFGEQADAVTPAVMMRAKTRLGAGYDALAPRMSAAVDTQVVNDLARVETEAKQVLADQAKPIEGQITHILELAGSGMKLSGEQFQALTRKGTPLDQLMSSDNPNLKYYAGQLRGVLNDAMERSSPPAVRDELRALNAQWRSMKTVENLVAKSPTGDLSPALLMGRAIANDPNMAYTGGGELGTLARIGQQFLKAPANSGTAERAATLQLLAGGLLYAGSAGVAANAAGGMMRDPRVVNRLIQGGLNPLPPMGAALNKLQPYVAPAAVTGINDARR